MTSSQHRQLHTPFDVLYKIVREARNDALHQGAYVRHLTTRAIELSLVLEDALATGSSIIADYMVKGVMSAELWQPLSYVRQIMLANSYSFLPIKYKDEWHLISDQAVATALQNVALERKETLALTLDEVIAKGHLKLEKGADVSPDNDIPTVLDVLKQKPHTPILVLKEKRLLGIVTAFDLM